ncbi:YfhO family protein, partial [Candidatus Gottesmanbacteria bacterium]|nr:YfhO family protein [Candidatus Gottesmanbacteria bacterium]
LHQNTFPFWLSGWRGGFPLFANAGVGAIFAPNLVLYKFLDPVTAYNTSLVLAVVTIGWGMYAWLRVMGMTRFPSLFGALTFAFSGVVIPQLTHISLIQSFSLLPLIAAVTVRVLETHRVWFIALFAFLVSQQIFAGFPQTSFITMLLVLAIALWYGKFLKHRLSGFLRLVLGGIAALGIAAVQLLPTFEYLQNLTVARGFSPEQTTYFSYPWKHLVTLLNPFFLGNPAMGTYPHFTAFDGSIFWENTAYVGLIPLFLLILGLFIKKQAFPQHQNPTRFLWIIMGSSFFLMLGKYSPIYLIHSFWPFTLFRVPSRFIWVFAFCLVTAGSAAMHTLWHSAATRRGLRVILVILVIFNTFQLLSTWFPYHAADSAKQWLSPPPILNNIPKGNRIFSIGAEASHNKIFLSEGWQTMKPYEMLKNTLTPDKTLLWGVPHSNDYTGRSLARTGIFDMLLDREISVTDTAATISAQGKKLLDLLGVGTVVSTLPLTQSGLVPKTTVSDGQFSITAYQNPDAVAPAYLATSAVFATTVEEAVANIRRLEFVPGRDALIEQNLDLPKPSESAAVTITKKQDGWFRLSLTGINVPGLLVISETYYPGWQASVDGRNTPVLPVNIRYIGVVVPPGSQQVTLRFTPSRFLLGLVVSLVSLFLTVLATAFPLFSSPFRTRQGAPWRVRHHPHNHGRSPLHITKASRRE